MSSSSRASIFPYWEETSGSFTKIFLMQILKNRSVQATCRDTRVVPIQQHAHSLSILNSECKTRNNEKNNLYRSRRGAGSLLMHKAIIGSEYRSQKSIGGAFLCIFHKCTKEFRQYTYICQC